MAIVREGQRLYITHSPNKLQTCFKQTQSLTGNSNSDQTISVINIYNQKSASLDLILLVS